MFNIDQLQRPITAKTLLLDLMRASAPGAWPVKELIEVGTIFGIQENALRVNITRLLAKSLLEQDERGSYRLVDTHNPLREWLHSWRRGEDRVQPWAGDWLSLSIAPVVTGKGLSTIEQACMRLGLRRLWQRLWLRPNNLAIDSEQLSAQLVSTADDDQNCQFMLAVTTAIRLPATVPTLQSLWQVDAIEARLAAHIQLLQQSMANLANKSSDQQLAETFILGGEGIHLLSLDPLLPREFFNVSLRRQLTELMKEYDNIGKHYWMQRFNNSLTMSPSHLQPSLQQTLLPAYHR